MATAGYETEVTLAAGADLTGKKFYGAKLSTAANRTALLATSNAVWGVIVEATATAVTIGKKGIFPCIAGGNITAGSLLTTDANGKFVAVTEQVGGPNVKHCVAEALEAAAANDVFSAWFTGAVISVQSA